MDRGKYIIIDDGLSDNPIIFPESIGHDTIAKALTGDASSSAVLSAGFVEFLPKSFLVKRQNATVRVECSGRSNSLDLGPRPEDARIIARAVGIPVD